MTSENLRKKLDTILPFVVKPQRYLGGEINSVVKLQDKVRARICLVFPDLYEIGASNNGLSLLYHTVNSHDEFSAERAFLPDFDMIAKMENSGIPLYSLETFSPLSFFDAIGITLQYEMNYTNIPKLLSIANISVLRRDRLDSEPLVIMGGPLTINPMPMAEIADSVVIGDGEDVVVGIMKILALDSNRKEKLAMLSMLDGVYVPEYPPKKFVKARIANLKEESYTDKPLVPLIETVHLRSAIEIMRGCSRGCRFCAAGYYYRPVRERSSIKIANQIKNSIVGEGWRDISLLSLSTADYSGLMNVLDSCYSIALESHVSLSLPSTRLDKATEAIFGKMDLSRRTGITLAPEAGSDRLRNVINKNLAEEEILGNIRIALRSGYQVIKLYFMLGLPTETDDDVDAMALLILKIEKILREFKGRRNLNVSVSPFSPKPGTPFERVSLISEKEWDGKIQRLRAGLRGSRAELSWGDAFTAKIETILARGDKDTGKFIVEASARGLLLQSWKEHFNPDGWRKLIEEYFTDTPSSTGELSSDMILPWDMFRSEKEILFLKNEYKKALAGESTPDCRIEGCTDDCGACNECVSADIKSITTPLPKADGVPLPLVFTKEAVTDNYFAFGEYEKGENVRFVPHRDMTRLIERAFRVCGIKLSYSQGFSAHPEISFTYPLSLGMTGKGERMGVVLLERLPNDAVSRINNELPDGLKVRFLNHLPKKISLEPQITAALYKFSMGELFDKTTSTLNNFIKSPTFIASVRTKSGDKACDLKSMTKSISVEGNDIIAELSLKQGAFFRPSDFLKFATGLSDNELLSVRIERVSFLP